MTESLSVDEARARLAVALKRKCALKSLKYLNANVFGMTPTKFWQAADPHAHECINELNDYVQDWLEKRAIAKKSGVAAFSTMRKFMYIMPRECLKSSWVTQSLPILAHLWEPDIATAIASAVHDDMAVKYGRACAGRMAGEDEHNTLVDLFGTFKDPSGHRQWMQDGYISYQRRSMGRRDPTLGVFSVSKGATGGHFDLIVVDDPETGEKVQDHGDNWHEKVYNFYQRLYPCVQSDGLLGIVMTRYGDGDLIGRIVMYEIAPRIRELTLPGSPPGTLPADWDEREGWVKYAHLAGWKVIYERAWDGDIKSENPDDYKVRFPVIWTRERILDWISEKGEAFVMAQLQNMPSERSDNPIQPEVIERVWCEPHQVPPASYNRMVITMDLAWKDGVDYVRERGDDNVIEVWSNEDGHVYLVNGWCGRVDSRDFLKEWIRLWKWAEKTMKGRVIAHTIDKSTGGSGDAVRTLFKQTAAIEGMHPPRLLELPRAGTKKIDRILSTTGYWQSGLVHLVRGVHGSKELAEQMLKIGYSMHDDHADAAADIFHDVVYRAAQKATFGGLDPEVPRAGGDFRAVTYDPHNSRTGDAVPSKQARARHEYARARVGNLLFGKR